MNAFMRARKIANNISGRISTDTPLNLDKTLVIVDMQSGFMNIDEHDILPAICSLVRHAIRSEWGIFVVEFNGHGTTHPDILKLLTGYPHWVTVQKGDCDGSEVIIETMDSQWSLDFLVCGIYGPECVAATVDGLLNESNLVEVSVVEDAIYPSYCPYSSTNVEQDDDYRCEPTRTYVKDVITTQEITI